MTRRNSSKKPSYSQLSGVKPKKSISLKLDESADESNSSGGEEVDLSALKSTTQCSSCSTLIDLVEKLTLEVHGLRLELQTMKE